MDKAIMDEVSARIKKANPNHILYKFILKNYKSFTRVMDDTGFLVNTTANKELFKFGLTLKNELEGKVDYKNIHITDEEGKFLLSKDFAEIHGFERDMALYNVSMEDYVFLKKTIDEYTYIASLYDDEIKRMNEAGFIKESAPSSYTKKEKKNKTVIAFTAELDYEQIFAFAMPDYDMSMEGLEEVTRIRNNIRYNVTTGLSFVVRCIEFGMYKNNFHIITEGIEKDFKLPKGRIKFQRLTNAVEGVNIRFRDFEKKI